MRLKNSIMNGKIDGKLIVIADCHFGIRRFNIDTLKDQLSFFDNQIFPYMEENNINKITKLIYLFFIFFMDEI